MTSSANSDQIPLEHDREEEGGLDVYLADSAPLLYSPPEEEGANDNARLIEVVQGTVWRNSESLQGQSDGPDGAEFGSLQRRSENPQELDFSESGSRRRGFLDEDWG
ncbi:MAG: hypothetical protein NXI13_02450 [Proteobacteria bacterium]|nr:hypothetical protein [Pseudomonadota bacterium]